MKRANIPTKKRANPSERDEGLAQFDIHKGCWLIK